MRKQTLTERFLHTKKRAPLVQKDYLPPKKPRIVEAVMCEEEWMIPHRKRKKAPVKTNIPPHKRTFKNIPKYSTGKKRVRFQDWLLIKGQKRSPDSNALSFGKSEADGKWYGWSHRAVYGFKAGDTVKSKDYVGREYIKKKPPFTLKTEKEAREMAIAFARSVS
jgi:hypothetical protein